MRDVDWIYMNTCDCRLVTPRYSGMHRYINSVRTSQEKSNNARCHTITQGVHTQTDVRSNRKFPRNEQNLETTSSTPPKRPASSSSNPVSNVPKRSKRNPQLIQPGKELPQSAIVADGSESLIPVFTPLCNHVTTTLHLQVIEQTWQSMSKKACSVDSRLK